MPEVRKDVRARMTGDHWDAIERVIEKLYCYDSTIDVDEKKDMFRTEMKHFQNQTGVFDKAGRWNTADVISGRSYLWHEKYSLPYTEVLGHVGYRTISKVTGIGSCERAWGDVKHIKTGKRKHLSARATEMQSIIYTTARIGAARIKAAQYEGIVAVPGSGMWNDDDINFDLDLENFGVDTSVLRSVSRNRYFRCWVEDWEKESRTKNDPVQEAKLLQKYKDMLFFDPDNKVNYTIHPGNMEFRRGRGGGWMVIAVPPADCGLDDEPFEIGEMLMEMIVDTQQADNITMIRKEDREEEDDDDGGDDDDDGDDNNEV